MAFDQWARWSYERLLLLQPEVEVTGLWKLGERFYAVCPGLTDSTLGPDGTPFTRWFSHACKAMTSPIVLAAEPPPGAEVVLPRTAAELSRVSGAPRTIRDVLVDLNLALPKEFPNFIVDDRNDGVVRIRLARALSEDESAALLAAYVGQALPTPMVVEVDPALQPDRASFRFPSRQGDIDLLPSRRIRSDTAPAVKSLVEDDEDFWSSKRESLLGTTELADPRDVLPKEYLGDGLGCFVNASVFPRENLRNYLSLYRTVHVVAPLADKMREGLEALDVTEDELVELAVLGRMRVVLPQSMDRYSPRFVAKLAEAAPKSLLMSRRLAAATIVDTRRRWPIFYPPLGVTDRRALLVSLAKVAGAIPEGQLRTWFRVLRDTLIESWTMAETMVHDRGAMGTMTNGVAGLAARLFEAARGKDIRLEIWTAGSNVEWASALAANLFPYASEGYSEEAASEMVASLYGGLTHDRPPTIGPEVHAVMEGILTLDNKVPIVPFARDFGSGDIERLRDLVLGMARWNLDPETLQEKIKRFNDEIRQYEKRPDHLRTLNIVALVASCIAAALPGGPDTEVLRRALPISAVLMNMLLLTVNEEFLAKSASLGAVLDFINGRLAGQRPEAVLVSRVRRHIKITKG